MAKGPKPIEKEAIAALPFWARVALAVRCAQRVEPLFTHLWPEATDEMVQTVRQAIAAAERAAKTAELLPTGAELDVGGVSNSATFRAAERGQPAKVKTQLGCAAMVAAAARSAAAAAAQAFVSGLEVDAVRRASDGSIIACETLGSEAQNTCLLACRHDLEKLQALATSNGWTDDSPVDCGELGELWPESAPKGWPAG